MYLERSKGAGLLVAAVILCCSAAGAQPGVEDEIRARFEAGRKAQQSGELIRAESEYRQVLGLALSRMGAISSRLSDFAAAERAFRECVQAIATSEEGLMGLGVNYLRAREYEKAAEAAFKLLDLNPFNRDARQLLGKVYLMQRKFQEAVTELSEANRKQEDFGTSYALALAYMNLGRLDEVRRIFDRMAALAGNTPQVYLLFGRAYREIGQSGLAMEEFRKALELDPKLPRVHYYMGLTHLTADPRPQIEPALEEFRKEAAAYPREFPAQFFIGMIYARQRRFDLAVPQLRAAVGLEPSNFKARYYLGLALSVDQRFEEAIPELRKALDAATPRTDARSRAAVHYQLAQCLRRTGRADEAQEQAGLAQEMLIRLAEADRERLESPPHFPLDQDLPDSAGSEQIGLDLVEEPLKPGEARKLGDAHRVLANFAATAYNALALLHAAKDVVRTAEYLQLASHWDGSVPDLYFNLGLALFRQKKYDAAVPALEKALEQDPEKMETRRLLGIVSFMSGEYAKAADMFSQVVGKAPEKDPQTGYSLALSLVQVNRADEAMSLAERLLAAVPKMAELHVLRGQIFAQRGEYDDAVRAFDQALAVRPEMPDIHFFRGMAYLRQSEFDKAVQDFGQELKQNPQHVQAKYHIAFVAITKNEGDKARALLEEVIRMDPNHAEALYQMGKLQLEQGELAPSVANLETAASLDPNKSYIFYQLYRAYTRTGRTELAREALVRYQKLKAR